MNGFDYSQPGAYSVTICVEDRLCLFGEIIDGEMQSNAAGRTVERIWRFLPRRFVGIGLDAFVVMPNHMHGIILIGADPAMPDMVDPDLGEHGGSPLRRPLPPSVGADLRVCPAPERDAALHQPTLGTILQWFKTITTTDYIAGVHHMDWPPFNERLWQRGYHDRIVRNDRELEAIRRYVHDNPAAWANDEEHPARR
jgi:REP element-mobilizing transposase RayT